MKQLYKAIGLILFLIAIVIVIQCTGVTQYLSLDYLSSQKDTLKWYVEFHYTRSVVYYLLLYAFVIACAVPAVAPLTMFAGFLFGVVPGACYALIGSTAGATVSFFVVRYVLKNTIQRRYRPQIKEFNEKLGTQGRASYLLTLQFLSVIPFFVINTLAALAHVSLYTFVWTTIVGSIPIVFLYAFAGRQLIHITSIKDIFTIPVIAVFVLLVGCALLPIIVRSRIKTPEEIKQ